MTRCRSSEGVLQTISPTCLTSRGRKWGLGREEATCPMLRGEDGFGLNFLYRSLPQLPHFQQEMEALGVCSLQLVIDTVPALCRAPGWHGQSLGHPNLPYRGGTRRVFAVAVTETHSPSLAAPSPGLLPTLGPGGGSCRGPWCQSLPASLLPASISIGTSCLITWHFPFCPFVAHIKACH